MVSIREGTHKIRVPAKDLTREEFAEEFPELSRMEREGRRLAETTPGPPNPRLDKIYKEAEKGFPIGKGGKKPVKVLRPGGGVEAFQGGGHFGFLGFDGRFHAAYEVMARSARISRKKRRRKSDSEWRTVWRAKHPEGELVFAVNPATGRFVARFFGGIHNPTFDLPPYYRIERAVQKVRKDYARRTGKAPKSRAKGD